MTINMPVLQKWRLSNRVLEPVRSEQSSNPEEELVMSGIAICVG